MDSFKGFFQSLPRVGAWFRQGDIQPEEVQVFWRHMQRCFPTDAVCGHASPARLSPRAGVAPGHCLHLPFEVGVPRAGWDLWRQVVACTHAVQHALQFEEDGLEVSRASSAARARSEAEALRCDLELHFWRHGTTPPLGSLAWRLRAQGCHAEDIAGAGHVLALSAASIRQGAVENEASHVALQWLEAHVPHLRWDRAYHSRAR